MTITLTREYRFWRYRIFVLTWLTYGGFYLCRKNFSIAMPLLSQDHGFTKDNFALLLFFYSLFYALGQFYNGFLSDKFGPRLVVGIGLFLSIFANVFQQLLILINKINIRNYPNLKHSFFQAFNIRISERYY